MKKGIDRPSNFAIEDPFGDFRSLDLMAMILKEGKK
jgi:hypothetical protein